MRVAFRQNLALLNYHTTSSVHRGESIKYSRDHHCTHIEEENTDRSTVWPTYPIHTHVPHLQTRNACKRAQTMSLALKSRLCEYGNHNLTCHRPTWSLTVWIAFGHTLLTVCNDVTVILCTQYFNHVMVILLLYVMTYWSHLTVCTWCIWSYSYCM